MKDESPKCDCGGMLEVIRIVTCREVTKINKNGTMSKISEIKQNSYSDFSGAEWLECKGCNTEYEFTEELHTNKIRILKKR